MGKKGRKPILASEKREEEEVYDSEDDMELLALKELEAERMAEEAEVNAQDDHANMDKHINNRPALRKAAEAMTDISLPWVERLDVVDEEPLQVSDVHDDLARELAFYEMSLASVKEARSRLKAANIPWKRPEDFFCEMIKSDTHMARVKERLLFEQKKMEAFEQRKQRQSQRKFSKSQASEALKEKAASRKETIAAVTKWRHDNKKRRKEGLADNDAELSALLSDKPSSSGGKSKKRKALDKKYGFGGQKNKKATRNDPKALNDMRGFNPKAMKATARRNAQQQNRPGKAARAQKRTSNRSS